DERLPGEGSICEDRGWAAVVVGTLDDVRAQKGGASAAHVVLETIRAGGPEGLNRLRGVFATVVTDGRRVWAARDHVGTETLYYQEIPGRLLLSGGIDSPAVAAYAGTPHPHVVGAISAVYPQHPTVDERGLVEMLAGKYGLELQTFTPGPLKLDRLAEWVRTFDGPWSAWHPG